MRRLLQIATVQPFSVDFDLLITFFYCSHNHLVVFYNIIFKIVFLETQTVTCNVYIFSFC